jgi:site-specific recombinase XerD
MSHNIAAPIHSFFETYLTAERGLSSHTVIAYRDAMKLFLAFGARQSKKTCVELTVEDLTAQTVRAFLEHLEKERQNGVRTRNARLAVLHAFYRYLASLEPSLMQHCHAVLGIRFKRHAEPVLEYLEQEEVMQIFRRIHLESRDARRDDALLRMLYNTGARAQEVVGLDVNSIRFSRPYLARIKGKGSKDRTCPLWLETVKALKVYLTERGIGLTESRPLFVNARGQRLSRFGLRYVVTQRVAAAAQSCPSLLTRKVGPHTFRHTTAMHLLQKGSDLNMIRSWLGHSSIETTHRYVEIDLDMKRRTLRSCERLLPVSNHKGSGWNRDQGILNWLASL